MCSSSLWPTRRRSMTRRVPEDVAALPPHLGEEREERVALTQRVARLLVEQYATAQRERLA